MTLGEQLQEIRDPARFVIDRTGVIRSADVDPDYTRRTEPSDTLTVLRLLVRGPSPSTSAPRPSPRCFPRSR